MLDKHLTAFKYQQSQHLGPMILLEKLPLDTALCDDEHSTNDSIDNVESLFAKEGHAIIGKQWRISKYT